ncbi:MAG: hypothetical protein H0X66_00860 [Verrucomicrobia bacterium]|nr:hypothetical protein [Verrucomicrobiota bacterium]
MKTLQLIKIGTQWIVAGLLCLATGCATKQGGKQDYVFYPRPPDEPRIQFLMSFSRADELGRQSTFTDFVVGKSDFSPISKPYGVALANGKIYVCDTDIAALEIVDLAKRKMRYFAPAGEGRMYLPVNIAVDRDGTRYVTDPRRSQVLIYSDKDEFLGAIGKKDEMKPSGIALFKDRIYVTDLNSNPEMNSTPSVRVYSKAGRELLFKIPRDSSEETKLYQPTNIAVDDKGHVYVSDTGDFNVKVYDSEGAYLKTIGEAGLGFGRVALGKGVAVDREGRVYLVDARTQVVQIFDKEGRILTFFGDSKTDGPGSTALPAGIAIDYDNVSYFQSYAAPGFKLEYIIIVANQFGSRKISVFGFGKKT